jgi:hypothetical protein
MLSLFLYCGTKQEKVDKIMEDGVEVVLNPIKPCLIQGSPSTLCLEEEFVIDINTYELRKMGLKDIWQFDIDSENNIYLTGSPPNARQIFKFDQNGNFVKAFSKIDRKTGEFAWLLHMRIGKNDDIVVVEGVEGNELEKILFFNTGGELVKEISRSSIEEIPTGIPSEKPRNSMLWDVCPLDNGNYLILKSLNYYTVLDHYNPLILCDSRWKEFKELDSHKIPGFNSEKIKKLKGFFPRFSWSVSQNQIYVGNDERGYEIHVYDLEGQLTRKIRKEFQPVQVTTEYKEKILTMFKNAPWRWKIYFPDDFPAFQYLFSDDEGRLFVMTYGLSQNGEGYIYDVFNAEGIFICRMSLDNYGFPDYWDVAGEGPLEVKAKRNRLYCNRMNRNGQNELIVHKMIWSQ